MRNRRKIQYLCQKNYPMFLQSICLFVAVGCSATEEDAFDVWTCITHCLAVMEFIHSLQVWWHQALDLVCYSFICLPCCILCRAVLTTRFPSVSVVCVTCDKTIETPAEILILYKRPIRLVQLTQIGIVHYELRGNICRSIVHLQLIAKRIQCTPLISMSDVSTIR